MRDQQEQLQQLQSQVQALAGQAQAQATEVQQLRLLVEETQEEPLRGEWAPAPSLHWTEPCLT